MWQQLLLLGLLALAGCTEVPPVAVSVAEPAQEPAATESRMESQPLKYLAGRKLKPQPTRPLNVRSRCSHRDAVGTATQLDLLVKEAVVQRFSAQVSMKGYGTCRFIL